MPLEKETYRDAFEQNLQEAADCFRMRPSRSLWKGIYNNLHPDKKWPSATSWLLLICFFFLLTATHRKQEDPSAEMYKYNLITEKTVIVPNQTKVSARISAGEGVKGKTAALSPKPVISGKSIPGYFENSEMAIEIAEAAENPGEAYHPKKVQTGRSSLFSVNIPAINAESLTHPVISQKTVTKTKGGETDSRFEYQVYAAPSLEFRESWKAKNTGESGPETLLAADEDIQKPVEMTAISIEAGGNIIFRYNPIMRFKAGLQVNYSSQHMKSAAEEEMPSLFSPLLINTSSPAYSSASRLSNESFQLSIPLGADLMIVGNDAVQWFAGATVQPSLLIPGNKNLLIYGPENELPDNRELLRNWNLNGGIETFVSFKTSKGITLNAGPQFRYQLLSSYKNTQPYNERLYNIGLKLGIMSPF